MAYRRNFRGGNPRGRGGNRNFNNGTEFSGLNRRQFYGNNNFGDNNLNDDENSENATDGETLNTFKGSKRNFSSSVLSDLNTLKNFTKQFQNGEKKNWPKYIREMNNFFSTSESFPNTLTECPQRAYEEVIRILTKIYLGKLYPDISDELVQCLTIFAKCLENLHHDFFSWMFSIYFNKSAVDVEETRYAVLKSLYSVIKQSPISVKESVFHIQKKLKKALEDASTIEMFLQTSELMIFIGDHYSISLQTHFKDFIDILLGWFLDARHPTLVTRSLEDTMLSLGSYWHNDLSFSVTLLSQFMEDFEKYFQEVLADFESSSSDSGETEHRHNLNNQLHKMASLARVFAIVLYRLDFASSGLEVLLTLKLDFDPIIFLLNTLKLKMKVVTSFKPLNVCFFEELVAECNLSICLLIEAFRSYPDTTFNFKSMHGDFIEYCNLLFDLLPSSFLKLTTTSLDLLRILTQTLNTDLTADFVSKLFSPQFQQLKFFMIETVQKAYIELLYTTLRIKSVPIVEQAYQCILKYLKYAFRTLRRIKYHDDHSLPSFLPKIDLEDPAMFAFFASEEHCLMSIHSDLALLAEIVNTKHSLIAMWALSPSFMDLSLHHLSSTFPWFIEDFPFISYSLIFLIFSYSTKHNNFINQSSLMQNAPAQMPAGNVHSLLNFGDTSENETKAETESLKSSNVMRFKSNPQNCSYFADILKLLNSLLKIDHLSADIVTLCFKWVDEIVEFLKKSTLKTTALIYSPEFVTLIETISEYSYSNDFFICKLSCKFIQDLMPLIETDFARSNVYCNVICNYKKACQMNIAHPNAKISQLFVHLLATLPFNSKSLNIISSWKVLNRVYSIQNELFLYPEEAHLSLVCLMHKSPSESFSLHAFQLVIDFILYGKQHSSTDLTWLSRLFFSVFDMSQLKVSTSIRPTISYLPFISSNLNACNVFNNNNWTLLFWACWELVQYCIENRLKTPLGKPQDTFTKIEATIKVFVGEISHPSKNKQSDPTTPVTVMRINMLLMIMDNFDKLIYNAISDNSLRLYTPLKLSKSFFKKNKGTCNEWINRNRRSIMIIALKLGEPVTVIRHGEELLRQYVLDKNLFTIEEIEFILLLMIDALIQLQAPEAVMGFYIWTKQTLNVRFDWIKTATSEANWRYENALSEYQSLLHAKQTNSARLSENQSSLNLITSNKNFVCNTYTVNFFHKRILNCFLNLERYEEAIAWSNDSDNCSFAEDSFFHSKVDYSYLSSLSKFSTSQTVENVPSNKETKKSSVLWDIESQFHTLQSRLFESTLKFYNSSTETENSQQTLASELNDILSNKLNPLLQSFYVCGLSAEDSSIYNLLKEANKIKELIESKPENNHASSSNSYTSFSFICNSNMDRLVNSVLWHKIYAKLNTKVQRVPESSMKKSLNDLLLRTATSARKSLNFNLAQSVLRQFAETNFEVKVIRKEMLSSAHLQDIFEESLRKPICDDLIKFSMEISKLCCSSGDTSTAIDILLQSINAFVEEAPTCSEVIEPTSRLLLKLVDYIQMDSTNCESVNFSQLNSLRNFELIDEKFACIKKLNHSENITGKMLLYSANSCPLLAKAWYRLADWSYKWGRKLSDLEEDKIVAEEGAIFKEDSVFEFYKLAANSYFKFLRISTQSGCDDVNATLRLLRLILKHAPELREILEVGLSETPTKPWKNITLQLFSRLNHHEAYVRQSISDLLCRIGADSPQLVIFPAVAGSLNDQSVKSKNYDYTSTPNVEEDEEEEEMNSQSVVDSCIMQNCYTSLLDTLALQNPNLISQTKLFVHELRRITVLWDELWIGTLQHNLNEVKRQVSSLEKEIEKTKLNVNLYENEKLLFIKEQHNIFFRRILYSLELTKLITSDHPETPHEQWFQSNFSQLINELIACIKHPDNVYDPSNILYHYQNLLQVIRKRSFISSSFKLQMQDISPKLAQLDNSVIPLPGLNVTSNVTLRKVFKTVSVLHTYTKPKKIVFIGSDGRNYTYLFKGHEDLHLDERIMQFLSVVNKMMVKFDSGFSRNRQLFCRARNYAVTPLGDKSGLIQWVEGGQALYNFYKRWLTNREVPLEEHINKKVSAVEIFKSKLCERGIVSENRAEWNPNALIEVYQELVAETPNDLIYKELWSSSINSSDYWTLTQNFITSNALMSMIGYILGLGDRHLDNILLDLTTGEVIHIDYNICFEKGKSLRVPEMVLCRLTQNIVNAFGITGIEGTFRISCEHVMKILRKGKEVLLTLLEAFVYDPLIDWTAQHEEGYTGAIYGGARIAQLAKEGKIIPKKQMERENMEAIARLNQLIQSVGQRNTDWPTINNDADLLQCGEFLKRDTSIMKMSLSDAGDSGVADTSIRSKKYKRNAYAFSVWKKIKTKLDGRDFDANKRLSVYEQVNNVLKESMDTGNLARMYEGWTSWV